jgi:REP-associated tyrosine transposase
VGVLYPHSREDDVHSSQSKTKDGAYPFFVPWGLRRFQQTRNLHFITFSCYHRDPFLGTPQSRDLFEHTLERVRKWYGLCVSGYVVMPDHVHLLISEPERSTLAVAIQMLKQNVGRQLRAGDEAFWQKRYYDFNVWSERKVVEKLRYMHRNPVKRGFVERPEDWAWSSFRHYLTGIEGMVEIESQWTARRRERMGVYAQIARREENPHPVSPKSGETRVGHPRG